MADDVNQRVEDALEKLVSITERSGNLRKDLKQDTLESVSVLWKEFSILKCQIETEREEPKELREEVKNAKDELVRRDKQLYKWRHLWTTCSKLQAAEIN